MKEKGEEGEVERTKGQQVNAIYIYRLITTLF